MQDVAAHDWFRLFLKHRELFYGGNQPEPCRMSPCTRGRISSERIETQRVIRQANMADQTCWADPLTARLVRIEIDFPDGSGHGVMSRMSHL